MKAEHLELLAGFAAVLAVIAVIVIGLMLTGDVTPQVKVAGAKNTPLPPANGGGASPPMAPSS